MPSSLPGVALKNRTASGHNNLCVPRRYTHTVFGNTRARTRLRTVRSHTPIALANCFAVIQPGVGGLSAAVGSSVGLARIFFWIHCTTCHQSDPRTTCRASRNSTPTGVGPRYPSCRSVLPSTAQPSPWPFRAPNCANWKVPLTVATPLSLRESMVTSGNNVVTHAHCSPDNGP